MSLILSGYNIMLCRLNLSSTQWIDGFDSSELTLPIEQFIEIYTYLVRVTTSPPLFLFCADIVLKSLYLNDST